MKQQLSTQLVSGNRNPAGKFAEAAHKAKAKGKAKQNFWPRNSLKIIKQKLQAKTNAPKVWNKQQSKQSLYKYRYMQSYTYILYTTGHCNIAVNFISPPVIIYLGQLKNKLKFKFEFFPSLCCFRSVATLKRATHRCKLNVIALPTTEAPMKTETEKICPQGQKWLTLSLTTQTHTVTHTHTRTWRSLMCEMRWASVKSRISGGRDRS